MKRIVLVFLASALIFSCQKKELKTIQMQQDVVFNVSQIDPGSGLKSTADWTCPTDTEGNLLEPVSAEIDIDDGTTTTTYSPAVFRLDGNLYTQAIKLPAAQSGPTTYTVTRFVLKDAGGTIIMATPITGSDYSEYVSQGVTFTFEVNAFAKAEVPVEVLCFLPEDYTYFGFDWFNVTEIVVREVCFFGDICLDGNPWSPSDFDGSMYDGDQPPAGTQPDMPAIFEVHVYKDGVEVPHSPFTNGTVEANYGVGSPLCVQYPDNLNVTGEEFTFELWVLVPDCGGTFDYRLYHTFTLTDDGTLPDVDADGVTDFVIGSCNLSNTDLAMNHFDWLVLQDLFDENNSNGFLYTKDPTVGALWKWTRADLLPAHNITEPMGYYLNKAGFPDIAELAFDAIWNDLNNGERFWSTTLSGLVGGYNLTGDTKYLTMANSIMDAVYLKYHPAGTAPPRTQWWGYDYLNILRSAKLAKDAGVNGSTYSATQYYNELVADYLANYQTKATDDYHRIFINVIATELGIGTFQGSVTWDDTQYGVQEAAYGLIGGSWDDPVIVKTYIRDNICSEVYSEPVAEGIYALGL